MRHCLDNQKYIACQNEFSKRSIQSSYPRGPPHTLYSWRTLHRRMPCNYLGCHASTTLSVHTTILCMRDCIGAPTNLLWCGRIARGYQSTRARAPDVVASWTGRAPRPTVKHNNQHTKQQTHDNQILMAIELFGNSFWPDPGCLFSEGGQVTKLNTEGSQMIPTIVILKGITIWLLDIAMDTAGSGSVFQPRRPTARTQYLAWRYTRS